MSIENNSDKITHSRSTRIPLIIVEHQHDVRTQHRFRKEMLLSSKQMIRSLQQSINMSSSVAPHVSQLGKKLVNVMTFYQRCGNYMVSQNQAKAF